MATLLDMQKTHGTKTKPYLNDGFVTLLECMGSDKAIEEAARMSYGDGTRQVSDTRNLLRYLMRHEHTSPFEMAVVRFHIKVPIFVARQFVRHRTFSLNELSGRYSVINEGFYTPELGRIQSQSESNKQGSSGVVLENAAELCEVLNDINNTCDVTYSYFLDQGMTRELARIALPLSTYTELVFKADLKNLMHFLRLRLHPHAQLEIQKLAQAIYELLHETGRYDITLDAFMDYHVSAVKLTRDELTILRNVLHLNPDIVQEFIEQVESSKLSQREKRELIAKFEI